MSYLRKTSSMSLKSTLGPLEHDIMNSIWKSRTATVRDVLSSLRGRELAYTTVMTVMNRLVQAGWLERHPGEGGAFTYSPTSSREQLLSKATRRTVDDLVKQYGDIALVQFLERLDEIPASKLHELRKLLKRP